MPDTSGPIWLAGSKGSPTSTLEKALARALDELVVALSGDHDPGQRRAHLAGQRALGLGQRGGGLLQVHVVEDQRGRLAAQLERAAGDALAADRGDLPPGRGRPGEGDLVHPRVADQQLGDLTVGGHHVEHTGRKADGFGDLCHHIGVAGGLG